MSEVNIDMAANESADPVRRGSHSAEHFDDVDDPAGNGRASGTQSYRLAHTPLTE